MAAPMKTKRRAMICVLTRIWDHDIYEAVTTMFSPLEVARLIECSKPWRLRILRTVVFGGYINTKTISPQLHRHMMTTPWPSATSSIHKPLYDAITVRSRDALLDLHALLLQFISRSMSEMELCFTSLYGDYNVIFTTLKEHLRLCRKRKPPIMLKVQLCELELKRAVHVTKSGSPPCRGRFMLEITMLRKTMYMGVPKAARRNFEPIETKINTFESDFHPCTPSCTDVGCLHYYLPPKIQMHTNNHRNKKKNH
jgi:hypothetical protein